ncbi:MAG: NHL repeat-containing protein [bacterium]
MNRLNKILILAGLIIFCSSAHSQDTTAQKQDTAKIESGIPVECTQVINIGYEIAVLAVDSKGNFYVNGGNLNAIKIYNPMGEYEGNFSLQDGQCPPPWEKMQSTITGIDIDLDDNIYLCNAGHNTIEKFTTAGDFLEKIILPKSPKGEWYGIRGVVVDEEGTIYMSAYFKFVYIFNKEGKLLRKWAKSGNEDNQYACLSAVAIDRYKKSRLKRIYLGDNYGNRVYVYSKKEKRLLFSFGNRATGPGGLFDIIDMDVDSEGYIYVLDRYLGYCSVFNTEGKFVFRFGHEEGGERFLYFPMGIFIDQNDKIYISNSGKGCILVYEWKRDRKRF